MTPPAERISMADCPDFKQKPTLPQVVQYQRVGGFDEFTGERVTADDLALQINIMHKIQPVLLTGQIVILAVGRRNMHDAGAVIHRDKISSDDMIDQAF